jgi:hypothetical protein
MIYQGETDLVYQADARVSTFASGLMLVERSAIAAKHRADNARPSLQVGDRMPLQNDASIDGVFIFPQPQEVSSATHVTFLISGYGRSTDVIKRSKQTKVLSVTSQTINSTVYKVVTTVPTELQSGVIAATDRVPLLLPSTDPVLSVFFQATKKTYPYPSSWKAEQITRTNYGLWDEFSISWDVLIPETISITL